MKPINLATVFRVLLVTAWCGSVLSYTQERTTSNNLSHSASQEGEPTFQENCASCHGLDGHGGERAPDIAARRDVQKLSDAALLRIVREGIPGTGMPSFGSLGNSRLQAVVRHLRTLQGRDSIASLPGSPVAGKGLFFGKAACSQCHMVNGAGGFIGSDLSSYARARPPEQIREALTNPNKNLEERAKTVVATTVDGQTFTGVARNEDNFSLQLQTLDGVFHFLDKSRLRNIEHRPESLMPADYASRLNRQELNDIISYLIDAGRETRSASQAEKEKATPVTGHSPR